MKKHIFGFALFSLILVSFVFTFAMFKSSRLEILNIETKARKLFNKQKLLDYKVQNVQFDLDTGKLISSIELTWNGEFKPPAEIFMNVEVSGFDQNKSVRFFGFKNVSEPFKDGNKIVVIFETTTMGYAGDAKDNLYASFGFSDEKMPNQADSELSPVLFVHGENSIIKE